ncbi:hypothetical protein N7461_000223 [Penicillium sp. DV-2018c]|nr:hypothetical protein N7461_000223 [Penicillium sp. DV-2018c]
MVRDEASARNGYSVRSLNLDLESFAGTSCALKEHFSNLIDRAWEELGQDYFDKLVRTMNHRVEAVISSQMWYIEY